MAFNKIIWQDLPNETTPLNADNLNLLVQDMMMSDEYDPTSTYTVGSYCIYQNTLYKCTTEIATAEEFNAGHWTETTISNEITAMQSDVTNIESDVANLENKTQLATTTTAGLMSATDKAKLDNVHGFTSIDNITFNTTATNKTGGYFIIGKIMVLNLRFTTSASVASGNTVITNLPKTKCGIQLVSNTGAFTTIAGSTKTEINTINSITSGTDIKLSGVCILE